MNKRTDPAAILPQAEQLSSPAPVPQPQHGMDELAPIRRRRTVAEAAPPLSVPAPAFNARFLALIGSGNVGKSVLARLFAEWARATGRPVGLADADRHHQTLSFFFEDVMRPEDASGDVELTDAVMKDWFENIMLGMFGTSASIICDIGGSDTAFARMADELCLVEVLASQHIAPIAVHVLGPRVQDLTDLRDMEDGAFRPEHTLLVLNEGAMRGDHNAEAAFQKIQRNPVYRAALDRGAVEIRLPALQCMREVDGRRISFEDAAHGRVKLGQPALSPFDAGRVRVWLNQVEAAFAPVKAWLP